MKCVKLYTDGGCRGNQNDNNIGAYAYRLEFWIDDELIADKEVSEGEYNTTNNIQELKAIIKGLKSINDKYMTIYVYSDSAYCINGITQWIEGWKRNSWVNSKQQPVANKELWIELDELKSQFHDIHFLKVKGHANDEGNNRVDLLLNKKMDILQSEDELPIEIPYSVTHQHKNIK